MNYELLARGIVLMMGIIVATLFIFRFTRKGEKKTMAEKKYNKDGSVNLEWFAEEIAKREGKKVEVNIAQIKEILKITLGILHEVYNENADKVQRLIENS